MDVKSEVFLVIVAVLVLALWVNLEGDHEHVNEFRQKHPPFIRLSEEDAEYTFETGSYELTPVYERALWGLVPRILELLRDCGCDTLEVIGTADNTPLAKTSDLDLRIHSVLRNENSVVAAGSSNDLSLLRAVAVLTFLRSIPELESVAHWAPLSRAQTVLPDGSLDLAGERVSDPAPRSIEIRFLSSSTEVEQDEQYVYTAFSPHAISTAAEAVAFARLLKRGGDREDCLLFFLDEENRILSAVGRVGAEDQCRFAYPNEAPESAVGVLLVHDHWKGDARPSRRDRDSVSQHRSEADSLGLKLLDFIVWTDTEYSSLEDFGATPMHRAAAFFGIAPRQIPVPRPRDEPAGFVWPVAGGGRISSGFGWRSVPKQPHLLAFHAGIDIESEAGTGVCALGDGNVRAVGENANAGRFVELDLGSGWSAFYSHLDEIRVARGDAVEEGQVLATVGSTGNTARTNLHLC